MIQAMGQNCRAGGIRLLAAVGHELHVDFGSKGWIGFVIGEKWMLGLLGNEWQIAVWEDRLCLSTELLVG